MSGTTSRPGTPSSYLRLGIARSFRRLPGQLASLPGLDIPLRLLPHQADAKVPFREGLFCYVVPMDIDEDGEVSWGEFLKRMLADEGESEEE